MDPQEVIPVFKNEELAVQAFRYYRLKKGITCKKCGSKSHYWLGPKRQFQCKKCRFRTTLQSGSVLEGSKLPLSYFFIAIYLLLKNGSNLTLDEFKAQTGHKYYEPLYDFLKRIKGFVKSGEHVPVFSDSNDVVNQFFAQRSKVE